MPCVVLGTVVLMFILLIRVWFILPQRHKGASSRSNHSSKSRKLAIFLGSGKCGHTSEALALLSTLDFQRYSPRLYIISEGDHLSAQKARTLEASKTSTSQLLSVRISYSIITIPRARKVHQPILTTPPTALVSLLKCIYYVTIEPLFSLDIKFADVLILNGPGTCFVLCLAVYINKILGLPSPKVLYVESFARVKTLSVSGKILRNLVDRFIVQWPQVLDDGKRGEYHGWLV
ncbi:glycosyltransferase family 1 protein [Dendrothele bispora CBS 962.96]|uniref:UDP-N-acetylglucosamine transferase subunit ALG14 n=1 Tax=Dendrothele bispora (strain CBS 962.96) TaxID=1314807 RepID=A0A4S8M0S7_DENBC|nr:glycosyltransferase family 1 protein [Dendrothele bispora CBS 962.96]